MFGIHFPHIEEESPPLYPFLILRNFQILAPVNIIPRSFFTVHPLL
jgi:hypothetical protein